MHDLWDTLFGPHATPETITALQMATRAVLVFLAVLVLLRLSGTRTFASNTAFDMVVKIMLGAVMSRAVVAETSFGGTMLAGLTLVAVRRLLAWTSFRSALVSRLVQSSATVLAEHGQLNQANLSANNLTEQDLLQGLRTSANLNSLAQAETVRLERDGSISVVKKAE